MTRQAARWVGLTVTLKTRRKTKILSVVWRVSLVASPPRPRRMDGACKDSGVARRAGRKVTLNRRKEARIFIQMGIPCPRGQE